MDTVVRTIAGSMLQTAQHPNLPFTPLPYTTLNEKFQINQGVTPSAGVLPSVGYFCIGNKGHQLQSGTGGVALAANVPHVSTDAALYQHLPFILRATSNDIDVTTRTKYALRKQITVNGQNYYAYYLKRLDKSAASVSATINTITNELVTNSVAWNPTSANLSPTPPVIVNGQNALTSQYGIVSAPIPMNFTATECTELLNAATILFGDPAYAIISEIGLCSGVDYSVTLPGGVAFNEAIAVQITAFVQAMQFVQANAGGITSTLNVGTQDPLLVLG